MKKFVINFILMWIGAATGFAQSVDNIEKDSFLLSSVTHFFVGNYPLVVRLQLDSILLINNKRFSGFYKSLKIKELKAVYEETQIKIADAYTQLVWREDIVIEPNAKNEKVELIPARYDTLFEKIQVKPITFKFVKRNVHTNVLSMNNAYDKRIVQCFKRAKSPSDSMLVRHYVLVEPPKIIRKHKKKVIIEKIALNSDSIEKIFVPAQYQIIHQLVKPNDFLIIAQDTTFYMADDVGLYRFGAFYIRNAIPTEDNRDARIYQLQIALKKLGYYDGQVDNFLNEKTKKALLQFQKEHHLQLGLLTLETFKSLGILFEPVIISDLHDENDSGVSRED